MSEKTRESRERYLYWIDIPTRWMDGDPYGHVNNVEYYSFIDTAVTRMLLDNGVLRNPAFNGIGLCVESQCQYHAPISFPEIIEAGVRIGKTGNSSLRYEVGLFKQGEDHPAATGSFIHVFVDPETHRPTPLTDEVKQRMHALTLPS